MTNRLAAYGLFMTTWAVLEVVIEVAITKQLGLDGTRGNIVTSGLQFERRASILRSLLALHGTTHAQAIKLITQITQDARRNTLTHGLVRVSQETLDFVKRETVNSLKATKITFTTVDLVAHVQKVNGSIMKLQELLGITDADLEEFSIIAENLANKSATSPKPPNSTKAP
jgi:hypothetical protein